MEYKQSNEVKQQTKNYIRFKAEEELLKAVLHSLHDDVYPKVSAIGGKKINPDIDILQIERLPQNQFRLVGYEIKLIKFDKRSRGLSWNNFYSGLGQALLYLENGVHRACLVLGFHENVPNDELIDEFLGRLRNKKELLKNLLDTALLFMLKFYKEDYPNFALPLIGAEDDLYSQDNEVELLSNELLQGKLLSTKS
jgi:hypothetical protein